MLLFYKLALVAASVLLATLAARRFGHAVGGAVAGMPMIAGPIVAVLLIDHDAELVRAVALATLVCLPITGSVLPCFTLPRHGPTATASLLGGFLHGLHGFAAFFAVLYVALAHMPRAAAFVAALGASLAVAALMHGLRRRLAVRPIGAGS